MSSSMSALVVSVVASSAPSRRVFFSSLDNLDDSDALFALFALLFDCV